MPACVELIGRQHNHPIFSIAHYYEQESDLVADPDMTFWVRDGKAYPLTFEQGGVCYRVAVRFEAGVIHCNQALQTDITAFANTWMLNIREQQFA